MHGHEAALNVGGDAHFLAIDALAFLGHHELRVIDKGGCVRGDGAEEIVVDLGEAAGFEAAVEIEKAEEVGFARGSAGAAFAERDAGDGADAVRDHAGGADLRIGAEGVGNDELVGGADGLTHRGVGESGFVGEGFTFVVAAKGECHCAGFVAEEDVAALHLGELEGGIEERNEDLIDGVGGLEFVGGFEEPAELFEGVAGGADFGDLVDDVADGGRVVRLFRGDVEAGAVECAEVDGVTFGDELTSGGGLAIDEGAVAAALIDDEAAFVVDNDLRVVARNVGVGQDEVILRQAADSERRVGDGAGAAGGAVDQHKGNRGGVRGGHCGSDYRTTQ